MKVRERTDQPDHFEGHKEWICIDFFFAKFKSFNHILMNSLRSSHKSHPELSALMALLSFSAKSKNTDLNMLTGKQCFGRANKVAVIRPAKSNTSSCIPVIRAQCGQESGVNI